MNLHLGIIGPFGTLGNNVLQMLRMMRHALPAKCSITLHGLQDSEAGKAFRLHDLQEHFNRHFAMPSDVELLGERPPLLLLARWYWDGECVGLVADPRPLHLLAKEFLLPFLRRSPMQFGDRTLVAHLRSGDIFAQDGRPVHPHYHQPPLNFYLRLLEKYRSQFDELKVVTSPTSPEQENPVLMELRQRSPIPCSLVRGDMLDDYCHLIGARHLVLSNSSFARTAMVMSCALRRTFSCKSSYLDLENKMFWDLHSPPGVTSIESDAGDDYLGGPWVNSEEQRKEMLSWSRLSPPQESHSAQEESSPCPSDASAEHKARVALYASARALLLSELGDVDGVLEQCGVLTRAGLRENLFSLHAMVEALVVRGNSGDFEQADIIAASAAESGVPCPTAEQILSGQRKAFVAFGVPA